MLFFFIWTICSLQNYYENSCFLYGVREMELSCYYTVSPSMENFLIAGFMTSEGMLHEGNSCYQKRTDILVSYNKFIHLFIISNNNVYT